MTPTGYALIDHAVIEQIHKVGCTAAAVYVVLAGHADEGRCCWPSETTIARLIGRNTRTVRTALRRLESVGLIHLTRRRRDSSVYHLPTQDRQSIAEQEAKQDRQSIAEQEPRPAISCSKTGNFSSVRPAENCREKNTKKTTKKTGGSFDPLSADLPFESERFRQSWSDFAEHRRAMKHPLSEAAASRILARLAAWGEPKAVDSLDASIENGWRGVFEPRGNGKPAPGERKCRVPTDEELANWNPYGGNGHDH